MLTKLRTAIGNALHTAKDRGASAVEYGLMVAAIAAVIVGIVFGLGSVVKDQFTNTKTSIDACTADPTSTDCTGQ